MLQWIEANFTLVLGVLLIFSEFLAAACQMIWPANKGISGVFAAIIKVLQGMGAKQPTIPS